MYCTSLDWGVFQTATDYCGQKKPQFSAHVHVGGFCLHTHIYSTCEVLPVFVE